MGLGASPLKASPQEVIGSGYRAVALGNTGAASARDGDAVYGNPALLSLARRRSLQLGLSGAVFGLRAVEASPSAGHSWQQTQQSPLRATTIAATLPLPFGGMLRHRVALGLSVFTPVDVVVRGRILYPERPQFLLADRVQSVGLQAGLGVDLGWGIRLGAGVAALAALTGSVDVGTDASGRIGTVVEDTLVASYAPIVGASMDLGKGRYRLGAVFRGELVARFNVQIRASDLGALDIPPLNISGVAQYDPWQIALEAARVHGPWRVAVGATYKHWAAYPGPVQATVRCSDNPDPDSDCAAAEPPAVDYDSVVTPRVGVERLMQLSHGLRLSLRGGYAFELSPAPEQRGRSNYFSAHRSVFSVGYGLELGGFPLSFDGYAQVHFLHPRQHRKDPAAGAETSGSVGVSGHVLAFGMAAKATF